MEAVSCGRTSIYCIVYTQYMYNIYKVSAQYITIIYAVCTQYMLIIHIVNHKVSARIQFRAEASAK